MIVASAWPSCLAQAAQKACGRRTGRWDVRDACVLILRTVVIKSVSARAIAMHGSLAPPCARSTKSRLVDPALQGVVAGCETAETAASRHARKQPLINVPRFIFRRRGATLLVFETGNGSCLVVDFHLRQHSK
jgi:hypothetical protein